MADFNKCGLLVMDEKQQILLLRKVEDDIATKLSFPGAEYREGEDDFSCLKRGVQDELSCETAEQPRFLGEFEDLVATDDLFNEKTVSVRLFEGRLASEPALGKNVAELVWYAPGWSDDDDLAPILHNKIIPFLVEKEYFS